MAAEARAFSIGRYVLHQEIASGGMATVHFGQLLGAAGFARTVAIKRLHPQYAKDPEFRAMLLDEARIAGRLRHPNVVGTLDVVAVGEELFLVMDYVHGESLYRLLGAARGAGEAPSLELVSGVMCGVLYGLHAAHEARDERGDLLEIVHRDVSPQNVIVSADGVARVLDFGVAKAAGRSLTTHDGKVKGKLAYMALEQLRGGVVDRRADIYAAGVVLWEALTGRRLFAGENDGMTITNVLENPVAPPSEHAPGIPRALDELTLRALSRKPARRFATAKEMAEALAASVGVATQAQVAQWVERHAGETLAARMRVVESIERGEAPEASPSARAIPASAEAMTRSQASSISVATERTTPRRSPRWVSALAIGGVAMAVAAVAGARYAVSRPPLASARGASSVPASPSPPPQNAAPADTRGAPGDTGAAPADTRGAPGDTGAAPADTGGAAAAPRPTAGRKTHVPHTKAVSRPAASAAPSASAKPCPMQQYIDADGLVRFRRACP